MITDENALCLQGIENARQGDRAGAIQVFKQVLQFDVMRMRMVIATWHGIGWVESRTRSPMVSKQQRFTSNKKNEGASIGTKMLQKLQA